MSTEPTTANPGPEGARRPRMSRRRLLTYAGAGGVVTALGVTAASRLRLSGETTGEQLTSTARLPRPFEVPLPVPPVATPVSRANGVETYELEQREARLEILPGLKTTVWGYDGLFPGRTLVGRRDRRTVVRLRNRLPVPTSTHLHGGVTPPESDGYPTDLLLPEGPAGRRDWTKSMSHGSGHGHHSGGSRPAGAAPEGWKFSQGEREYEYPLDQPAATLWYHDHRMDFSAPQVWRGLAGFFLVRDDEEEALGLPEGERDVPLMLCDRSFEEDGSFSYPSLDPTLTEKAGVEDAYHSGVLGDVQLVNGAPWPEFEVTGARYRLRLLNAANARRYRLALEDERGGKRVPLVQVGSDCGLLDRPVTHETLTMAPAERFDVVVDFSRYPDGSVLTLVNTLGDGDMGKVMRFRVKGRRPDDSRVPDRLVTLDRVSRRQSVRERSFDFRMTTEGGHSMWTVNGRPFSTDGVWASPRLDTVEVWRFTSDFHHPVHLHLAHFKVLSRSGRAPSASDAGWKDTVDVRPYEVVEVLARFRGYKGRYMMHCHNLEHEDMAMMANFDIV
ncbi:multicopper oxidase domain-containing protein [Streptomyces sp. NPDC087512]|uniref:multicopper oxidase family protein n=1 Tax=Streptomyces sp. NPDC087512 TaxID=3155059 RepID=UPI003420A570